MPGNFNRDEFHWVTTGLNATLTGRDNLGGTFDEWVNNVQERAFYLVGRGVIPQPGTRAMLIAGFGVFGAAARRRRPAIG